MFTEEIGATAGKVWQMLKNKGEMSMTALKKALGSKDAKVDWAIGWLAREGKIEFRKDKNVAKIALRE